MSDPMDAMRAVGMSVEEAAANWIKAGKLLTSTLRAEGEDEPVTDPVELVAWLLEQLDEDELAWQMVAARDVVELLHGEPLAPRMLADIKAKRALLAELASANMVFAMRLLAQPYAGRPGWREEWAS